MKVTLSFFVLLLITSILCDEAVVTLTKDNFDSIVDNADLILVEFYAPWCGHCKHLAPEFEKAAQILQDNDPPIILGKVDATVDSELAEKFGITGYPTLFVFRKGTKSEYQGPREANGIVAYMEKQAGPGAKKIESQDALDKIKKRSDVVVIAFTSNDNFRNVADKLREEFTFGEVTNADLRKSSGFDGKIVLFRRADSKEIVLDPSKLEKLINENSLPIAGELTIDNAKRYRAANLPIVITYIDVDWDKNVKRTHYYQRRLLKVGLEFEGKLLFAIAQKAAFVTREPTAYGIDGPVPDFVTIIEDTSEKKYLFHKHHDSFNVDNIKAFANDYLAGKLSPFFKSEPIPENDGPLTVVVGANFDEIVLDDSKNVLIEFYAPWCGHCKTLAPKYEELAKEFEKVNDVVIAKIDATANDYAKSQFEVTGFPTIYFKPKGHGSNVLKYNGAREVKDMKAWVNANKK